MLGVMFRQLGPYHFARLNALAASRNEPVLGLEVDPKDTTYSWKAFTDPPMFRHRIVLDADIDGARLGNLWRRIHRLLDEELPTTLAVPGWSDPAALAGLAWARSRSVPAVVMSDSTADDEPRRWWREAAKRRVLQSASAALVAGSRHTEYLRALGVPGGRIFRGYDVVDNDHFARGAEAARSRSGEERARYSLPDRYFLTSARFVHKKNLSGLVEAFAWYREATRVRATCDLVILGDGSLRSRLEQYIAELGLGDAVHLPGFRQYDELPAYYGLAEAFILPSTTDQWGLVVNEAMASGLPVLVSKRCGCAADLVAEGVNGFTFDPYDAHALAGMMHRITNGSADVGSMGLASREIIDEWDLDGFVSGMCRAIQVAPTDFSQRASLGEEALLRALALRPR